MAYNSLKSDLFGIKINLFYRLIMLQIGITYNPSINLFYSSSNQTSLLLTELFKQLGYNVSLVNSKNTDIEWWSDYPKIEGVTLTKLYQTTGLDYLIDVDGFIHPTSRKNVAKHSIVFLRSFIQFSEMDNSVYPEKSYTPRSYEGVSEIWCWDILNPAETLPSIQTLYPCPIKTVPFTWSPQIASHYSNIHTTKYNSNTRWTIHITEKNNDNSSSSIIPLVAIRELVLNNVINAEYKCHNMERIIENKFLKENVLNNIEIDKIHMEFAKKIPYYELLTTENNVVFSHSRFTPLRIGLLNVIWLGIPLIHNSPVIHSIHPELEKMFYFGNEITGISRTFKQFTADPTIFYKALNEIQQNIMTKWSIASNINTWRKICGRTFSAVLPLQSININVMQQQQHITHVPQSQITIAFCDFWPGFNFGTNFIIDALSNTITTLQPSIKVIGVNYIDINYSPDVVIFGPYSNNWKNIPAAIPKVFFTGENWPVPQDESIKLFLTPLRNEDDKHIRLPTWMTFIDWFTNSTDLPEKCEDNPIRLPIHFATTSHPIPFNKRTNFCGFVVSNPICGMRNDTFNTINEYKHVNSGGSLYNNIGGQLSIKYPGGGCGDISKYKFFSNHKFTISFENSQASGYITEKVLHAKMAGCIPLYWGDINTDSDFVPGSIVNLSQFTNPVHVLTVLKKLEDNPEACDIISSTPILNEEKKQNALDIINKIAKKILHICGVLKEPYNLPTRIAKIFVINLDTRKDRWDNLLKAEPYLEPIISRVAAVNGKNLQMSALIYKLFKNNKFNWKKSVIGCSLSHINIWSKIINDPGDYFLILEDDVRFNTNWNTLWSNYANTIPDDAELLYLGGILPPNKKGISSVLEPVNEYWGRIKPNTLFSSTPLPIFHFCAYSYILTKKGANKLMEYIIQSNNKVFAECDHFISHPLVGLKKYIANPLLSYCFQEEDPVYINSQFNDLHREDKFDSDICNNNVCFTQTDLEPFIQPINNKITIYYHNTQEIISELFEYYWLQDIFTDYTLKPLINSNATVKDGTWFFVQRPYSEFWNNYFIILNDKGINFKVLHLSDEFMTDNISFYTLPTCKGVIRNYWRNDVPNLPHIITIPLGYHHKGINSKSFIQRELIWSFHGTSWFDRTTHLENIISFVPHICHFTDQWNSPNMTGRDKYLSDLSNSKFCPIPKGNNIETFRLYEALEQGTIPIYVRIPYDDIFWNILSNKLELINIESWDKARQFIKNLINNPDDAENYRMKISEKWKIWKSEIKAVCFSITQVPL